MKQRIVVQIHTNIDVLEKEFPTLDTANRCFDRLMRFFSGTEARFRMWDQTDRKNMRKLRAYPEGY